MSFRKASTNFGSSLGCLDSTALNYNSDANVDNDSCCYISGCTNPEAYNYNSNACYDNGSCIAVIVGCTDPTSFNYNIEANTDDGSCVPYIFGCIDESACNYDPTVNTDNSSCTYPIDYYDCDKAVVIYHTFQCKIFVKSVTEDSNTLDRSQRVGGHAKMPKLPKCPKRFFISIFCCSCKRFVVG